MMPGTKRCKRIVKLSKGGNADALYFPGQTG